MAWAAIWLFRATGEDLYLTAAKDLVDTFGLLNDGSMWAMSWDSKTPGVIALMYRETSETKYKEVSCGAWIWVAQL